MTPDCGQPWSAAGLIHQYLPMTRSPALRRASWQDLSEFQSGLISRSQLLGLGLTAAQARADIKTGRWKTLHPGVSDDGIPVVIVKDPDAHHSTILHDDTRIRGACG